MWSQVDPKFGPIEFHFRIFVNIRVVTYKINVIKLYKLEAEVQPASLSDRLEQLTII